MKLSFWERIKYTLDIEKPSDYFMWAGFSIIIVALLVLWCTILFQMYQTNPMLGIFMTIVTVAFVFIFTGLGLYEKGY